MVLRAHCATEPGGIYAPWLKRDSEISELVIKANCRKFAITRPNDRDVIEQSFLFFLDDDLDKKKKKIKGKIN